MLLSIEAFQMFIASVLMFCAQLGPLPSDFGSIEDRALRCLFLGPKGWISTSFLKAMTFAGFPKEFMDIPAAALAARVRVALHEDAQYGGLRVQERSRQLRSVCEFADDLPVAFLASGWIKGCFLFSLEAALASAHQACPDELLPPRADRPEERRVGCQARLARAFRTNLAILARQHLRARLDRWSVPVLPGRRVDRWIRSVTSIAKLVAPRVLAAVHRTAFNGWLTARRFQQQSLCVFGCVEQPDAIERYSMLFALGSTASAVVILGSVGPRQTMPSQSSLLSLRRPGLRMLI